MQLSEFCVIISFWIEFSLPKWLRIAVLYIPSEDRSAMQKLPFTAMQTYRANTTSMPTQDSLPKTWPDHAISFELCRHEDCAHSLYRAACAKREPSSERRVLLRYSDRDTCIPGWMLPYLCSISGRCANSDSENEARVSFPPMQSSYEIIITCSNGSWKVSFITVSLC